MTFGKLWERSLGFHFNFFSSKPNIYPSNIDVHYVRRYSKVKIAYIFFSFEDFEEKYSDQTLIRGLSIAPTHTHISHSITHLLSSPALHLLSTRFSLVSCKNVHNNACFPISRRPLRDHWCARESFHAIRVRNGRPQKLVPPPSCLSLNLSLVT